MHAVSSLLSATTKVLVVGVHERASLPPSRPVAPFVLCLVLITLLLVVYVVAVVGAITGVWVQTPSKYYDGADIVGLVVTCVLFGMTMWCFVLTAVTDPGKVPREFPWAPEMHDPRGEFGGVGNDDNDDADNEHDALVVSTVRGFERKSDGRTRVCKTCRVYKPDRAHHCRRLGRCVLEMDHWCVWVRNTIGYRNKKYFILMLTYGLATLISYCVTLGPFLPAAAHVNNALDFFIMLVFVLACIELVLLLVFWGFHVYLACKGFTTIEFREKRMGAGSNGTKTTQSGQKITDLFHQSPYDLGIWKNLRHLFGENIILWLVPTRWGMANGPRAGCVFEVRADHPLVVEAKALNKSRSSLTPSASRRGQEPDQAAGGGGGGGTAIGNV